MASYQDKKRKKLGDWQLNQEEKENREKEQNECLNSYVLAPVVVKSGLEQIVAGGLTLKLVYKGDKTIQCSFASIAHGS